MGLLWSAGHAAYVVGGSLRDALLGRAALDWDLATDARPDQILQRFPDAVYENAFGTVVVRHGGNLYEVTTFRTDHDYTDFRRPHRVEFGDTMIRHRSFAPPCASGCTSHNLSSRLGIGVRF